MARLHISEKWIYDAILNGLNSNPENKPMFKFDPVSKVYKYSNPFYPNKNYTKIFNPKAFMAYGDVINFAGSYRNENKMIFDGEKLLELYTEIDDYGSVPPQFKVGKIFKPYHWLDTIDHNAIIFLEDDLFETIEVFEDFEDNDKINGKIKIFDTQYSIIIYTKNNNIVEVKDQIVKKKPCFNYEYESCLSVWLD